MQEEGGNENEDLLDEEEGFKTFLFLKKLLLGVEIPLSEDDQKAIDRVCSWF